MAMDANNVQQVAQSALKFIGRLLTLQAAQIGVIYTHTWKWFHVTHSSEESEEQIQKIHQLRFVRQECRIGGMTAHRLSGIQCAIDSLPGCADSICSSLTDES